MSDMVEAEALERAGLEVLAELGWGDNAEVRAMDEDLWRIVLRNNFGGIWSRPGLTLREREMIVIAVLVTLGAPGVTKHFKLAHTVGVRQDEIREIIFQVLPFAGLPKALEAMNRFCKVRDGAEPSLD